MRWGNVARAAGAVAVVAVVVAWPRLAPPDPAMPGNEAAPLARDEPAWMPPREPGRRMGRLAAGGNQLRRGDQRGGGSGRGAPRREAGERGKGQRAERRGARGEDRERRGRSRGTKGEGSGQAGPADEPGHGGPAGRNESGAPGGGGPGNGAPGAAVRARAVRRGAEARVVRRPMGPEVAEPATVAVEPERRCARPGRRRSSGSRTARPRRRRRGPWRGCRRSARRSSRPDLGR